MPSRRRILGLAAIGIVGPFAGCLSPGGALEMTAVETDSAIGEAATAEVDPDRDEDGAELLEAAVAGESPEVDGERPPFDPYRHVRWEGAVYEVTWEVVDEQESTAYVVFAKRGDEDAPGSRIEYEALPDVDRDALADVHDEHGEFEDERVGWELRYADEDAIAESVLVPEPEYEFVVVDGTPFAIDSTTAERAAHTYVYDVTQLAPSPAAYGADLRSERLFELEPVTGDERELVEEAIEDGRAVVGRNDDAFVGVGETLLEREPIYVHRDVGEWLVEYEGEPYWTELDALRTTELVEKLEAYDDA